MTYRSLSAMRRTLAVPLIFGTPALAEATPDDGFCRNGTFAIENSGFRPAVVQGRGRAWFHGDMDGCPRAGSQCRMRSYLVPGDRVVLGRSQGQFVCTYFAGAKGGTAGWMESSRMKASAVNRQPALTAWAGTWSDDGNPEVTFRVRGRRLSVQGEAYWPGPVLSKEMLEEHPGWPHTGEIGGALTLHGNRAHHGECNVTFHLIGPYIIGSDPDMQCGGMNVSFSGVYRRVRR